jgi:molybdopterin-guanine dinucleotide biosynthesis protein B
LQLDQPGKDSFRHREAGAAEVLVASGQRWALFCETPGGTPDLKTLASRLAPSDLVLVEGFRADDIARIEIFRPSLGKPALWPDHPGIVAVASDEPHQVAASGYTGPTLSLNDPNEIARWIMAFIAACRAQA